MPAPCRIPPAMATAGRHHRASAATSRRPHPHLSESGLARSPSPTHQPLCQRQRVPSVDSGLVIVVLGGGTACAREPGTLNTSGTVKMDATEAKLYIDSMVLPVRQCSGFSDLKRNYVQGLVEPCVFAGTATTVYSYPSTDKTWLAWCSLDLPKMGVPRQDTYLQGECDRVLKREKSPTQTLTPTQTPAPTPQVYIACMNIHDDYFTCRCFLDDSAPGCR